MADALDVLVRIGVEDATQSGLNEVTAGLRNQANILKEIQAAIERVANSSATASAKTTQGAKATNDEYKKLYDQLKKLENENVSYAATVKKLQTEQTKLADEFKKNFQGQSAEVIKLNKEIDTLKTKLTEAGKASAQAAQVSEGAFSKIKSGLLQGLGIGAGFGVAGLVGSGIGFIKGALSDASDLAKEAEGVRKAFDRLDEPNLLSNLREATKGTISDLELMKQAVAFNNFGLPLNQLAAGMEFARIRAGETGQSVDYLTNSIVTGLGRKSLLILDNLGISAVRIREEFAKTGDFYAAVFNIIQEETAKAGDQVETFGQKIAALNASFANEQERIGQNYNVLLGRLLSFGFAVKEVVTESNKYLVENAENSSQRYERLLDEAEAARIKEKGIQNRAHFEYLSNFEKFTVDYASKDLDGRKKVELQAKQMYDNLLAASTTGLRKGLEVNQGYLDSLLAAYKKTTSQFKKAPINLKTLTTGQIANLGKEDLQQLSESIGAERNLIANSSDTANIQRLNKLQEAVDKNLGIINGKTDKSFEKSIDKAEKLKVKISELREEMLRTFKKGNIVDADKEIASFEKLLTESDKKLSVLYKDLFENLGRELAPELQKGLDEGFGLTNTSGDSLKEDLIRQQEEAERKRREKAQKKIDAEQRRNDTIDLIGGVNEGIQATGSVINAFLDTERQKTEIAIAEQRKRVEDAKEGNATILKVEQERLDRLLVKRQEVADKQMAINTALTVSQGILNVAQAIGAAIEASDKSNVITFALTIAAAVAAVAGTVVAIKGALSDTQGFFKGGYTGDGSAHEEAGVVHKGEYVIPKKVVDKYGKGFFENIHHGHMSVDYSGMLKAHNETRATQYDMRRLESAVLDMSSKLDRGANSVNINGSFIEMESANYFRNQVKLRSSRRR